MTVATQGYGLAAAPRRARVDSWALLALPGAIALVMFFLLPLGLMLIRSLTDPSPANYLVFTTSDIYVRVLLNTVLVSGFDNIKAVQELLKTKEVIATADQGH